LPFHSFTSSLILLGTLFSAALLAQGSTPSLSDSAAGAEVAGEQASHSTPANFTGSAACRQCHEDQYQAWQGSDHHHAFAGANEQSVKGNFNDVTVDYIDGEALFSRNAHDEFLITTKTDQGQQSYTVQYTLGHYPLQQYLLETRPGRFQVFALAWDTRNPAQGGQRWIELQPDESFDDDNPFHWTSYFQNWNSQCADCHATDYEKGFQAATDEQPSSYNSHWSEAGVGCEACHGPASQHIAWAAEANPQQSNGLLSSMSPSKIWQFKSGEPIASIEASSENSANTSAENSYLRTCARCHSLRHPIGDKTFEQVAASSESGTFTDHFYPQLVSEPQYFHDGQIREEVFVYGSFLQSKMHNAGVTCGNCHDAHSGKVVQFDADNIAHPGNDAVCAQCHRADVYAVKKHHQHPSDTEAARCVSCHMPATTYMMVDPRRDHSFPVPSPALSAVTGTPNACTGCHTDKGNHWAADKVAQWRTKEERTEQQRGEDKPFDKDFTSWQIAASQLPADTSRSQWQQLEQQRHELLSLATTPEMKRAMLLQTMPVFDQASFDALVGRLSDKDVVVRLAAIEQLAQLEPATRARILTPTLQDTSRHLPICCSNHNTASAICYNNGSMNM